ncbi:MAG: 4-alpha-glucanotransferase [Treponema sp.]|nr:4-alpha-glucanotransferase [Treponema sp.]
MENKIKRSTGVAVSLGALRTEKSPVIGEYTSLNRFALFCKQSGLSVIQLLPVLDTGTQSSPYSSLSAFALHPIYIDISDLSSFSRCYSSDTEFKKTYEELLSLSGDKRFDYEKILNLKEELLRKIYRVTAHVNNEEIEKNKDDFYYFVEENKKWLVPYCVFKSLKYKYKQAGWMYWDDEDKNLSFDEIKRRWNEPELKRSNYFYAWEQYVAAKQLKVSAEFIRSIDLILKCDIPILLNEDSCDVWGQFGIFNLNLRAGSPPDDENPTGQNWDFPVYDWEVQEKDGFSWWKERLRIAAQYFDAYRLDHVPGFFRFWAIPKGEDTAELGGAVPYTPISESTLSALGFSKERIRWLREPHLSTEEFFKKTGDFNKAHKILSLFCERIGYEEMWLFKKSFKSSSDIRKVSLEGFDLDDFLQEEIRALLCKWWKNRTLIEIDYGFFVPNYKFRETRAWATLNDHEKELLLRLFECNRIKQERQWERQAERIFSELIPATKMIPCAEDVGIGIGCMPKVLEKFGILSLKVLRWCRDWASDEQPFIDLHKYNKMSLITTSVHDSSTLRAWWTKEKNATMQFCKSIGKSRSEKPKRSYSEVDKQDFQIWGKPFNSSVAYFVLSNCATSSAVWFVNPLQDWLYLDDSLYLESFYDERINIPGTVSKFNWTWRMPVSVEKLYENKKLIEKINRIVKIHDEC